MLMCKVCVDMLMCKVCVDMLIFQGLWDSTDSFYYDRLHVSSQQIVSLRIRSLVGLLPLIAVHVMSQSKLRRLPRLARQLTKFVNASMQMQVSVSSSLYCCLRHVTVVLECVYGNFFFCKPFVCHILVFSCFHPKSTAVMQWLWINDKR